MSPPLFSQKNYCESSGGSCPWGRADYRENRRTTACKSRPGMGIKLAEAVVNGKEQITVEREGQRLVNPIRAWGLVTGSRCPWERADYCGKRRTTACESRPGKGIKLVEAVVHGTEQITGKREGQRLVNPIRAWESVSGSRCPLL